VTSTEAHALPAPTDGRTLARGKSSRIDAGYVLLLFVQFLGFLTFHRSTDLSQISIQAYFTAIPSLLTFFILFIVLRGDIQLRTVAGTALFPMIALVLYGLLSTFWSVFPVIAAAKNLVFLVQLVSLVMFVQLAVLRDVDVPECTLRALLLIVGLGLVVNVVAYGSLFNFARPLDWPYASSNDLFEALVAGGHRDRLQLIQTHPLDVSNLLSVAILLALFARLRAVLKVVVLAGLVLLLYLAGSRASFIGLLLACIASLLIRSRPLRLITMAGLVLAGLLAIQIWELLVEPLTQSGTLLSNIEGMNGRIAVWKYALDAILSHGAAIVFGFGRESGRWLFQGVFFSPGDSHHALLEVFLSYGLIGLCIAALVLFRLVRAAAPSGLGFALMVYSLILLTQGAYLFTNGYLDFLLLLVIGHMDAARRDPVRRRAFAGEPSASA